MRQRYHDHETGQHRGDYPAIDPTDPQYPVWYQRCERVSTIAGYVVGFFVLAYVIAHALRSWLS